MKPTPQNDQLVAGYYATKLVRGGPTVPVRLWFGPPPDPDHPGLTLDRSPRWQCLVDGREADPYEVWHWVGGREISEARYYTLLARKSWDQKYDPGAPSQNPERPVNLMRIKPPRFGR